MKMSSIRYWESICGKIETVFGLAKAMKMDEFELLNKMYNFIPQNSVELIYKIQMLSEEDFEIVKTLINRLLAKRGSEKVK